MYIAGGARARLGRRRPGELRESQWTGFANETGRPARCVRSGAEEGREANLGFITVYRTR